MPDMHVLSAPCVATVPLSSILAHVSCCHYAVLVHGGARRDAVRYRPLRVVELRPQDGY